MSHHIATGYAKGIAVIPGDLMALGPHYCVPTIASANLSVVYFHCAAIRITLNQNALSPYWHWTIQISLQMQNQSSVLLCIARDYSTSLEFRTPV